MSKSSPCLGAMNSLFHKEEREGASLPPSIPMKNPIDDEMRKEDAKKWEKSRGGLDSRNRLQGKSESRVDL